MNQISPISFVCVDSMPIPIRTGIGTEIIIPLLIDKWKPIFDHFECIVHIKLDFRTVQVTELQNMFV